MVMIKLTGKKIKKNTTLMIGIFNQIVIYHKFRKNSG